MTKQNTQNAKDLAEDLIIKSWDKNNGDQVDVAIETALEALAFDPQDWYINTSLGVFLRNKGDFEGAEKFGEAAVKLEPNNAGTWGALGITYHDSGKYELAVSRLEKSLDLEARADGFTILASAKISLGDLEGAIADSKRALELDPEWDEAEAMLKEAQELLDEQQDAQG